MDITYQLKGDVVVFKDELEEPIVLDLESAKSIIETIKALRTTYATAAAYERHLSKYVGALAFLEACLKSP